MAHNHDFNPFDSGTYEGHQSEIGQLLGQQKSMAQPDQGLFQNQSTSSYHQTPNDPKATIQTHAQAFNRFPQPQIPDPNSMMRSIHVQTSGYATAFSSNIRDMPRGSPTAFPGVNNPMGGQAGGLHLPLNSPSGSVVGLSKKVFEKNVRYTMSPRPAAFPVNDSHGPIGGGIRSAREGTSQILQSQFQNDIKYSPWQPQLPSRDGVL